jgi:HEAT repeat protein
VRRALVPWLIATAVGCGGGDPDETLDAHIDQDRTPATFELRPAVEAALAAGLEAFPDLVEQDLASGGPALDEDSEERLQGALATLLGTDPRMQELATADVVEMGDRVVPRLRALALDEAEGDDRRAAAVRLLTALRSEHAAHALFLVLENAPAPWLRAHAAYGLGQLELPFVVPGLVRRLKYEKDGEAVIWVARALAGYGNYSGLAALDVLATGDGDSAAMARVQLDAIVGEAGCADLAELWRAWFAGDPDGRLAAPARGPRFELAVWRWVARFTEFQLRGVDDARFVLERLGAGAVPVLVAALHDESRYVRVHVAQGLLRMGPRARAAGPELVAALAEPELAPHAAAALGAIDHEPAGDALRALLAANVPHPLRLAAARALGAHGRVQLASDLRPLLADAEPRELRQAAAESLVRLTDDRAAAALLVELLTAPRVEATSIERALRAWLAARAEESPEPFADLLARWDELEPDRDAVRDPDGAARRIAAALEARATLLRDAL